MDIDSYTPEKHTHHFALWAACRAAQRGCKGFNYSVCKESFERTGLRKRLNSESAIADQNTFDSEHKNWCHEFTAHMAKNRVNCSDGRAVKMINMYLKVRQINVALNTNWDTSFWHPPIDAVLLNRLQKKKFADRNDWGKVRWTSMSYDAYKTIITDIRRGLKGRPLWKIEHYWQAK